MTDIVTERREGRVAVLTLNRPQALNALNSEVMRRMAEMVQSLDTDESVGSIVITGEGKAFAAGADIKEMQEQSAASMAQADFFAGWQAVADCRTPMIAAVNGFALGGGCELAMMCDLIIASEAAQFGQPEILLGVIPGMGGSQRLTKAIGKYKAMDLILTGRRIGAEEAERIGLVSRLVPAEALMVEAMSAAQTIAGYSKPATIAAKEATNRALEHGIREGVLFERRVFHALFSNEDQKEGMRAFSEKRKPEFKHR